MIEITTQAVAPPVEREPLLTIDGVALTIPKRFLPTDMLQYLHVLQVGGGDAAAKWALQLALGDDGFWKLIDAGAALTEDALGQMINCVTGRLLGLDTPVPGPKAEPETDPALVGDSGAEPKDEDVWPDESSEEPPLT
jgi:hypothetical protein